MDIQEESEFNETMNLVKAVLERLEFHAFEDVLIWSNEHASKALLRCLKKTLSEFENGHLVLTSGYPKLEHFSVDSVVRGLMTALDQAQEHQDNLNREINELEDQLAKAQAVPEGFVVVAKELPEKIAEKMAIDRIDKPIHENDPVWSEIAEESYKNQVKLKKWEFWRDYKAMIEAQEQKG